MGNSMTFDAAALESGHFCISVTNLIVKRNIFSGQEIRPGRNEKSNKVTAEMRRCIIKCEI